MDVPEKLNDAVEFLEGVDPTRDPYDLIIAREGNGTNSEEEESGYEFLRARTTGDLPTQLGKFTRRRIENKHKAVQEGTKEGTSYGAGNIGDQKDLVQHVSPDEVPRFDQYRDLLDVHDFPAADYISEDDQEPEFQAILVRDGTGDRLVAYQDITRREILGKDDKIRFWASDHTYKEVNKTILEVPNRIDAIYYDGEILIFDQRRFEKIFDFMDEFEEEAESTVETIVESNVPIHSDDLFLDAATSYPNAVRILYAVRERALWEHDEVDMETFEYIIDEYDLSIDVEERNGERGISMSDKRQVWEVIHLYNDDHLSSPITEIGYQVGNKDARTEGAEE